VAACSRALAVEPGHREAEPARARAAECVARQDAELHEIRARADARPDDPKLLLDLGRLLEARGDWSAALEAFARCLRIDPRDAAAHFHAARASDRLLRARDTVLHCEQFFATVRGGDSRAERAWCVQRLRELR
jgi:Flp pilus assembly protein TadD